MEETPVGRAAEQWGDLGRGAAPGPRVPRPELGSHGGTVRCPHISAHLQALPRLSETRPHLCKASLLSCGGDWLPDLSHDEPH